MIGDPQERSPFHGRTAALATMHDKRPLIAPAMGDVLGMGVVEAAIDTDAFGTFAGDVPRVGTPTEVAIAKARAGMQLLGLDIGLASEGSIGPDPVSGLIMRDTEFVVLVDSTLGLEIVEHHFGHDTVARRHVVDAQTPLEPLLHGMDVPRHAVIVMPDHDPTQARKGLRDIHEIDLARGLACANSPTGTAVIMNDLRAHCSPSRQKVIEQAARDLAARAATPCPECRQPGWGRIDWLTGRTCAGCGGDVPFLVRGTLDGCQGCGATVETQTQTAPVSPAQCPACNP
jgi:hypothetical protein